MKLEGAAEENILTLLCWDSKHAHAAALQLDPQLFSTKSFRRIATHAFEYLQKFGQPPGPHLRDLLEDDLRRGEDGKLLAVTLDAMEGLAKVLQPDFVLETLSLFVRTRRLRMAFEAGLDALDGGDIEKAQDAVYRQSADLGNANNRIWLHDADAMLDFLDKKEEDYFSSGIKELDNRGVRPARKTMWLFIAPAKKGKSWHLMECGKMALMHGHRVLHITLENSKEVTAQRYVQALFAMTEHQSGMLRVPMFTRSNSGHITIDFDERMPDALMTTPRSRIAARLRGMKNKARFMIAEFPTSTLSISKLMAFLDALEKVDNFIPDMLIVDYPDLMQIDSAQLRIDTGRLFKELRGIAVTRNMALCIATQGSKVSAQARTVTATMVSEDYSKIGTADTVITYSQTGAEKRTGLARILVDAARNAADKFVVLISQSYATGQFCIDSVFMNHHVESEVERVAGDNPGQEREE